VSEISILPRHNIIALSKENSVSTLASNKLQQIFPYIEESLHQKLAKKYATEAALVQYIIEIKDSGKTCPSVFRLKESSLICIQDELRVSMRWVFLDWDLPSKGVLWTDPQKPETQEDLIEYIRKHPIFKGAYAFYFSKSGVRIIFRLDSPFIITSSQGVLVWKQAYSDFVKSIDISDKLGEIECRSDPFALSRVPNFQEDDGTLVNRRIVYTQSQPSPTLKLDFNKVTPEPKAKTTKRQFPKLPKEKVLETLWSDSLIRHLRESRCSLQYSDWRALGTNIYALLGDEGDAVFQDISSWDTKKYNSGSAAKLWGDIQQSASQGFGPITWGQFTFDLNQVYGSWSHKSSLAARIRRSVEHPNLNGSTPKMEDNSFDVYQSLIKSSKVVNGETIEKPVRCLTNFKVILQGDNRWKGNIRRNHLGSVDMLGSEPISDEDITQMREIISRVYGLSYSKDDSWDLVKWIAKSNEYHPIKDYLDNLRWDGKDRVGDLGRALGQNCAFSGILLRKFLISAVVRPTEWLTQGSNVNWKVDTVLILKGAQGKRKSSFFKALCSEVEWFSDNLPSITNERKDASLHMLGKWIVEQAEFEGHVARSSVENMKAFITREREIFRKPYGRSEINMRRPSILVGTTNSNNFLNDPTGDRRFWVLDIPDTHTIDLRWVKANRDQLWAQAIALYKRGENWWLVEKDNILNNKRNLTFRRPDALHEAIFEFLNTNPIMSNLPKSTKFEDSVGFTMKTLVEIGLDKKLADIKGATAQNVTLYLSRKGWSKVRTLLQGDVRAFVFRKLKGFIDEDY